VGLNSYLVSSYPHEDNESYAIQIRTPLGDLSVHCQDDSANPGVPGEIVIYVDDHSLLHKTRFVDDSGADYEVDFSRVKEGRC